MEFIPRSLAGGSRLSVRRRGGALRLRSGQVRQKVKHGVYSMSAEYRTYSFFDEIRKQLKVDHISVGKGALATMLSRLTEKELLIKAGRGQYRGSQQVVS